jgi:hypothetical protein
MSMFYALVGSAEYGGIQILTIYVISMVLGFFGTSYRQIQFTAYFI